MNRPLVSVIIPAYQCGGTVRQAIESALRQKIDQEILVINDCSGDDLDSIMEEYKEIPEVRYLKNAENLGAAGSRNRGVELARGKYIAFLDADDWWEDGKLSRQVALLEEKQGVLCCTARELINESGERTGRIIPVKEEITYRQLLHHNSINCSSVLIRGDVMREFRMEHEDSHEDYILWLNILRKYHKAYGINEPLLKYRLTNSGKSGSKLKSARMTFRAYRYAGLGPLASVWYFCCYAVNGVWKYWRA